MVKEITNLKTKHYQHKLGALGEVVENLDDIGQCYQTIIETIKGDVALMPNLGTNIIEAIGEDFENADRIAKAIILTELQAQEPRGEVVEVSTSFNADGRLVLKIDYKSKLDNAGKIASREVVL